MRGARISWEWAGPDLGCEPPRGTCDIFGHGLRMLCAPSIDNMGLAGCQTEWAPPCHPWGLAWKARMWRID